MKLQDVKSNNSRMNLYLKSGESYHDKSCPLNPFFVSGMVSIFKEDNKLSLYKLSDVELIEVYEGV